MVKKISKLIFALEDKLIKYRNQIDGRTLNSLRRKLYGCRGIKSLNNLLKKYSLGDIDDILSDNNYKLKLQQLKDHSILKEYSVTGKVGIKENFYFTRNGKAEEKTYEKELPGPDAITARSKKEAEKIFKNDMIQKYTITPIRDHDSPNFKSVDVDYVNIDFIDEAPASASSELVTYMQASKPVTYDFIPNDEKYNKNDNFCVFDTFVGIYSQYIKKMTKDYFISLCEEVLGIENYEPSPLDAGCDVKEETKWVETDIITIPCIEFL